MSGCCRAEDRKPPTWRRRLREVFAWALPGVLLAATPKCPLCLAAHLSLWTGLGLSLAAATYLRWSLLILCFAAFLFLIVKRLGRGPAVLNFFRKETEPCNVPS